MYSALHNHTMYSLLDGYGTPEEMLQQATNIGLKAYAITEHGNEYSWCYFDKLKSKYPNIKIIYGVEMYECFDRQVLDNNSGRFHLIVLAKNENGRKALNRLVTLSNFDGFYYKPRVQLNDFKEYANDLIVCSACLASKIAREPDYEKCIEYIKEYKSVFPYYYLEMQSHSSESQIRYNQKILQLAADTDTEFIITTDSHAATKEDLKYQGRHVQIAHDSETVSESYEGCYLQSENEIHNIMDSQIGYDNVCIALENTNKISDLIEEVKMPFQEPQLPTYPLPEGFDSNYDFLKNLIDIGLKERKITELPQDKQQVYLDRIDEELETIHSMNFDGYFIIVWDFLNWCRNNNVEIGQGRGSAAGSLICYLLNITNLDPIKYGLIFSRFLNKERISYPDIDSDVANRDKVINYLTKTYGEENVCQIINFSYITPVVAIKDVGKILGFKYSDMDKLSKRFTYEKFDECLEHNKQLLIEHPEYEELIDIASHLSGRIKTVSCHAGGVGIVDTNVNDYMAMKLGSKGEHVIQVDKRIVEEIGIIKFDILGVQTLSLVQEIKQDLNLDNFEVDINNLNFENDTDAYTLLQNADTNGVFQVESQGMKDLLKRLHPTNMEDVSAVLALYRPDSMGALEEFIVCKHDNSKVSYMHDDMKPILENTYGCMIYQEQLMDIVRKFGGRSYGGADIFRKAIGKKNIELVKKESAKLYDEIKDNGYDIELADKISSDLADKGGYLFNKSHSYCYSVLTLQTAYLKAKYPVYFYKALFNQNKDKAGAINKYILDAVNCRVEVSPPNINKSDFGFSVSDNKILFGLAAITGIGDKLATQIIEERNANGRYKNLEDLIKRVSLTTAQVIYLIKAGAIPSKNKRQTVINYLKYNFEQSVTPFKYRTVTSLKPKKVMLEDWKINVDYLGKEKALELYNQQKMIVDKAKYDENVKKRYNDYIAQMTEKYLNNEDFWEFEALQIFLGKNPFEDSYKYISADFENVEIGNECVVVGVISKIQKKKNKRKETFAFVNIYSTFGIVEAIVWADKLREYEDLIIKGNQIAILCKKESDENVTCIKMRDYNEWLKSRKESKDNEQYISI